MQKFACGDGSPHIFLSWSPVNLATGPASCATDSCPAQSVPLPVLDKPNIVRATFTDNLTASLHDGSFVTVGLSSICTTGKPPDFSCPGDLKGPFTAQQGCNTGEYLSERTLSIRVSADCGKTWTERSMAAHDIDAIAGLKGHKFIDRPELFIDPNTGDAYLSMRLAETIRYPCDGYGDNRVVVLRAGKPVGNVLEWRHFATFNTSAPVTPTSSIASGPSMHECVNGVPTVYFSQPVPLPMFAVALNVGDFTDAQYRCGTASVPFRNGIPTASLAPSHVPNSLRVLYSGIESHGYQVLHLFDVTADGPLGFLIESLGGAKPLTIDESGSKRHAMFGQLISTDPIGGDAATDHTMLLRWSSVGEDDVVEKYEVLNADGDHSDSGTLATWSIPKSICTKSKACWIGDYHYGTVVDRTTRDGKVTLRFLAPWTQIDSRGALQAYASIVTVTHAEKVPSVQRRKLQKLPAIQPVASTQVVREEQLLHQEQ